MAEIIGLITFILCLSIWIGLSIRSAVNERRRKKERKESLESLNRVESRIQKIEDVYGETATAIPLQQISTPNISELLVVLEESQVLLLLGEAYNFSEILNIKIGTLDYIRLKHTVAATTSTHILERAASGEFANKKIKDTILLWQDSPQTDVQGNTAQTIKVDVMTSRLQHPIISIYPDSQSIEKLVVALSLIIDKSEHR